MAALFSVPYIQHNAERLTTPFSIPPNFLLHTLISR